MTITKSLYVDYCRFPKLARWRRNDIERYNTIRKVASEEAQQQLQKRGEQVEQAVIQLLEEQYNTTAVDLMPDYRDHDDEEDDEWIGQRTLEDTLRLTIEAIRRQERLLYQPTFRYNNCLVRADIMLWNGTSYDLIEVKAKNSVRKEVTDNKEKKCIGRIEDEFIDDISFQVYVINQLLVQHQLPTLGAKKLAHLNGDYVKQGKLQLSELLVFEELGNLEYIDVVQRGKETTLLLDNRLCSREKIDTTLHRLRAYIDLSEEEANEIFPWPGSKYMEYFGEARPFGTIMGPGIANNITAILPLYQQGITNLEELTEGQVGSFSENAQQFIIDHLKMKGSGEDLIDRERLGQEFSTLQYPICFYDYESVSVPIPFLDKSSPYQQVVVQYSLHKYYQDGTMKHYGGVFVEDGDYRVEEVDLGEHSNRVEEEYERVVTGQYGDLLRLMVADIGDDIEHSTFVVWHKDFENTRNKEIAKLFPDLAEVFLRINDQTFDLETIVKQGMYKSLRFEGSSSIKKVLPALVPSMSYAHMDIGKGDLAAQKLYELLIGDLSDDGERKKVIRDLLIYCGQDTLAMVRIFEEMRKNT